MSGDSALRYHEATKHSWQSVRSGGRFLDWSAQPDPFKRYPDLEPIPLPTRVPESEVPAAEVLSGAAAARAGELDLDALARLLSYSAGVTRVLQGHPFRAAMSAGALYPVELYVTCGELPGLEAGVYHFGPGDFALRRLREGDHRGALAAAAADASLATVPLVACLTGIPWRTCWKYGPRGYRHLFWDCGTILANLLSLADSAGLTTGVRLGFRDGDVSRLLGLDGARELPLALVGIGEPGVRRSHPIPGPTALSSRTRQASAAESGEAEALQPLEVASQPVSRGLVDYEEVDEVHRAGELTSFKAVAAWRDAAASLDGEPAADQVSPPRLAEASPPGPARALTIERLILRRGSTRRFNREPLRGAELEWPLAVAGRAVAGDFVPAGRSLLERFVNVHDVEEVEAGAYRWHAGSSTPSAPGGEPGARPGSAGGPDRAPHGCRISPTRQRSSSLSPSRWGGALELLRRGSFRKESAYLCLEQELGGDSAYTTFLCARLEPLLGALGTRGYRAAQLEAGIVAGRLNLAAFALGRGATGLTFYDDEISDFFGTDAQPMLVAAAGAPAYRARSGRPPAEAPRMRQT